MFVWDNNASEHHRKRIDIRENANEGEPAQYG
jgi:hypothetical protein